MKTNNLKEKIIKEITKNEFPDLKFLYSKESLELFPEILKELLKERKKNFKKLLKKSTKEVEFEDFKDFNKLSYLFWLLHHLDWVDKSEITQKIIEDFEPLYTKFLNEVTFSKNLYEKICYVLKNKKLDNEQKRILEIDKKDFELSWINLPIKKQEKIKKINLKLSKLSTKFQNNIIASKNLFSYIITDKEVIKDLPETTLKNALKKAKEKWVSWYYFDADPTSYWDIMEYCTLEKIRKDFSLAKNAFATKAPYDNRKIVLEILKLTYQKARLMWYKNFAEVSLSTKMAWKPEIVFELIKDITKKAHKKAKMELKELKKYFHLSDLKPWNIAYYSRKYKEEKYCFDEKELKKYFEFENVLKYLFDFIKSFYNIKMKKIDTGNYNEDVSVFEVWKNKRLISYYLLDPFYRNWKRPGAWADNPRWRFEQKIPFIVNVCNFQKQDGKILLTMKDTETLFHEFGHALHEMLSESKYSDLSGFNVEWDFVELPSQIHENWVNDRESLKKLARHFETWKQIPENMLDTLDNLKTYWSGLFTLRQNEFALLDMNLYSKKPPKTVAELDALCLKIANKNSVFIRWKDYKMYASFWHIFWWWYEAGYYSYMRAEMLEADVFEKIKELWMFDLKVWEKFIKTILGQWTKKEALELFKDFMWRELSNKAFIKRKGF